MNVGKQIQKKKKANPHDFLFLLSTFPEFERKDRLSLENHRFLECNTTIPLSDLRV
jgi:hypothetical protein